MGLDKPTTTAALLRRLALPAVFVAVVVYTQVNRQLPSLETPANAEVSTSDSKASVITELTGPTMGTTFTVKVRGPELDAPSAEALSQAVQGALGEVNASMSTWIKTSELSRFNDVPADVPFKFSAPTLEVFAISQDVYEASGGAFDVTVGPIVNRWGFGPEDPQGIPQPEEIATLLETVGQGKLSIDAEAGVVTKSLGGLRVDLSAVAKGYAADRVALAVEALGHASYMVEVGGELRTGTRGDGPPWRIAIERPALPTVTRPGQRDIFEVLELEGVAMATSGDYRNFIVDGDTLRSHTIDPRSGAPVTHGLASVTVVHKECGAADAWATALMVLGPEAGLALAEGEGLAAMFITRGPGQGPDNLERSATSSFSKFSRTIKTGPSD